MCFNPQYLCGSIHSIGNLKLNRHRKHHSREAVCFSDYVRRFVQTSVTQVYLQVTKRVQPKLAKGNDCLSVSYTHKVRITERVPQHPKNRRKDSSDKARHRLKNVAAKATSEQRQSRLMRPVCRGFCFFWLPKEDDRTTTKRIYDNRLMLRTATE